LDLAGTLEGWAARSPGKVALHFEGRDWTYSHLWQRIERLSEDLPVAQGERVAWLGYNHPELLVLLFALARRGAILVPLNWRLTAEEHREIIADCAPRLIFSDADFAGAAKSLRELLEKNATTKIKGGDDDVLIVYTSGTTGKPKGAVLTRSALAWNSRNSVYAHSLTPGDHVLTALPMFHVGGLNIQTLPALLAGATVTLHKRFDAGRWLAEVAARRPTLSLLVPATMAAVISHQQWQATDLSSLRLLNTGSMVVPTSLIHAFQVRGVSVGQIYGATETGPIATALLKNHSSLKVGSAGTPAPHVEVKVVDGEIQVRGPAVMRGYWRDFSGLAPGGWFRTGDLARVDDDGFYWIVGRSKDVIISGGENIHPAELENVLADCPAIAEAAVVGISDAKWGETACACVVARERLDERQIIQLFEGRLARYKYPKRVLFLEELPKNAMGKVQKNELKALVHAQLDLAKPL
jgi:fatty-acyl-CoA synthase